MWAPGWFVPPLRAGSRKARFARTCIALRLTAGAMAPQASGLV